MKVKVRFFAFSRELAGASEIEHDLTDGDTLADLQDALFRHYPSLEALKLRFAVNAAYAPLEQRLHESDEVAVIPPVGGG